MTGTTDIIRDGTDGHGEASAGSEASFGRTNTDPADAETVSGSRESNPPVTQVAGGPPNGDPASSTSSESSDEADAVEQDLDELTRIAGERDEYLDLARRTQADFENFRKRAARELTEAKSRSVAGVLRELLPVVDNLDRALGAAGGEGSAPDAITGSDAGAAAGIIEGIRLVHGELHSVLDRLGLVAIDPAGEQFDPNEHEAVASVPTEGTPSNTIIEVLQKGFSLDGSVVRPARVVVAA